MASPPPPCVTYFSNVALVRVACNLRSCQYLFCCFVDFFNASGASSLCALIGKLVQGLIPPQIIFNQWFDQKTFSLFIGSKFLFENLFIVLSF